MAGKRKEAIERHGWLDLIQIDGPFLSRPALTEQLDDAWPPRLERQLRERLAAIPDSRDEWGDIASDVDRFLIEVLGYQSSTADAAAPRRVTLTHVGDQVAHPVYRSDTFPVHAIAHPAAKPGADVDDPRMVVLRADAVANRPADFDPTIRSARDERLAAAGWRATPVQRAALAARQLGADLALVTDGYRHLVVWVGSGVTGYGWIHPDRYRLDQRLPEAAVALLRADRVCSRTDTTTADLLRISQDKQADLTGALGLQVRHAAEATVNAVSRANRSSDGRLLEGLDPHEVYRGVVTVLMRTVFLLNAEENDLIGGEGLYDQAYAVSTLLDDLDDEHHRHQSLLRQRHGAWLRLLAAARAVHGGVDHEQMSIYGYGGGLFDPSRHPFLEGIGPDGEQLDVGVVDDFTVRHVLDLLQRLDGQRLSYRAFSVEQIGQVYEHLLDHSARLVSDGAVILGLTGSKGAEPEVPLADLEQFGDPAYAAVQKRLAKWLGDTHDPSSGQGKAAKWVKRIEQAPKPAVLATLGQACRSNRELIDRLTPFLGLLDVDARGIAKVFLPGDIYVTETSVRRDSGTSYTSPAFAAEIAKHALRHLVYEAELETDEDPDTGLKSPDQILKLKVCDPAVGSGAIIVAAVRYLADRLVMARVEHGELDASQLNTAATVATSADPYVQARRDVVAQCIYAVDRDPMAVEMTKLSLWLISMAKNRPFTFIDHAIRSGDSLLGITNLNQLRGFHLDNSRLVTDARDSGAPLLFNAYHDMVDAKIRVARDLRAQVRAGDVVHPDEAAKRAVISARADRELSDLRLIADAITATCYTHATSKQTATDDALRGNVLHLSIELAANREALAAIGRHRPADATSHFEFFHWALEFPEVVAGGGFDTMVGNPPFQGGYRITGAAGTHYRDHIIAYCADGRSGAADLVVYFMRRASTLARGFGLIATNTVAQGDSRAIGLRTITGDGAGSITRAISTTPWPGRDNVHVSMVWWRREGAPNGLVWLDGRSVPGIDADLWPMGKVAGEPFRLPAQTRVASKGQEVGGTGFVLSEEEVARLLAADKRNAEVIRPYVTGSDINKSPTHSSERWVIDFRDWPESRAAEFREPYRHVLDEVKPHRDKLNRKQYRERWWRYSEYRPSLVARMECLDRVVVMAEVSSRVIPAMVPTDRNFSNKVIVFPWDDLKLFGVLSSSIHRVWVDRYSPTMKQDISYAFGLVFDTFPFPCELRTSAEGVGDGLVGSSAFGNRSLLGTVGGHAGQLEIWRGEHMRQSGDGITKLYGRYHDRRQRDGVTEELRRRHVELDQAVRDAYGWADLDLGHGFHETRYGTFFTVSTEARFELLMRLLELNFVQYADQTGKDLEQVKKEAQSHG